MQVGKEEGRGRSERGGRSFFPCSCLIDIERVGSGGWLGQTKVRKEVTTDESKRLSISLRFNAT
jgi:hypothetical protein